MTTSIRSFRMSAALLAATLSTGIAAQCPPGGGGGYPPPRPRYIGPGDVTPPSEPGAPGTPSPGGPNTPGPNTPGPRTPNTPTTGPRTPTSAPAMRRGPTTRRGTAMTFDRQATSLSRLQIDWKHPVPPPRVGETTAAAGSLPREDALTVLWEQDPRPLLVLRECASCKGTDEALLTTGLDNERTILLTHWFRCVRLPVHTLEAGHPFGRVFDGFDPRGSRPHMFLLSHPNAIPVAFTGRQGQSSLWEGMYEVLRTRYLRDPERGVKDWLSLLDHFDHLDSLRNELRDQLDVTRANAGPDSPKAKSLTERIAKVDADRTTALEREARIRDLMLQPMPTPAAPVDADAAAEKSAKAK